MLHNFTYKLKVNLTNKKKCLLRGNYSKSASDARQLSPDANWHLRYNINMSINQNYLIKIIFRVIYQLIKNILRVMYIMIKLFN